MSLFAFACACASQRPMTHNMNPQAFNKHMWHQFWQLAEAILVEKVLATLAGGNRFGNSFGDSCCAGAEFLVGRALLERKVTRTWCPNRTEFLARATVKIPYAPHDMGSGE